MAISFALPRQGPMLVTMCGLLLGRRVRLFSYNYRGFFVRYFIVVLCLFAPFAYADSVSEQLARAGADSLALQKMETELQLVPLGTPTWSDLKRKQVEIMRSRGQYSELVQLLEQDISNSQIPATSRWLQNQQIDAYLEAGQPAQAVDLLRRAIWQNASSYDPEVLDAIANWRRQLVEARVLAEQYDLAADTLVRYENDYQIESDAAALQPGIQRWPWQYQPRLNQELKRSRARLFLEAGEFETPAQLLKDDDDPSVQHVRLLSLLRTGGMVPAQVYDRAVAMANDKGLSLPARKSAWVLAADAARKHGDVSTELRAIKKAMITAPDLPFSEPLLALTASSSWRRLVGAGAHLMRHWSADISTRSALEKLGASKAGLEQRQAVLAQLFTRSQLTADKSSLLGAIVDLENDDQVRYHLLPRWLLENAYIDVALLSPGLRYELTELLLKTGDIPQAAELMSQLDQAPDNVAAVEWQLRRARVLVLAAKAEQGVAVLHQLLDGVYGEQPELERFLQAVFDVQAVGANHDAMSLFQKLLDRDLDARQRREIHYWLADAAKEAEDYSLAAEHYLLSAGEQANSWDPWGVSARRQAADALMAGGLLGDAINVYQRLLDRSEDRTERAVLRTNIQRLKAQL